MIWPLKRSLASRKSPPPEPLPPLSVSLAGEEVAVHLKRHASARRMTLRLSRDGEHFVLTVPGRHSRKAAIAFLETSQTWMLNARGRLPRREALVDGATISLRGETYRLVFTGKLRGTVLADHEKKMLHVPGAPEHVRRRLTDWLKQEAARELTAASSRYAAAMAAQFKRITVRDQASRWGSCTSDGALSYSWRLILAPPMVLDYVAAHEVAHLREMNHGPRFWRLVLTHCRDAKAAKIWLRRNGQSLHRVL